MNQKDKSKLVPSQESGRLIDFDQAEIRRVKFNDELFLFVSGGSVQKGFSIMLSPIINHSKIDFLTVEVLKIRDDAQNGEDSAYKLSLPLSGIAGKKGVTLIGASETRTLHYDSADS